MASASHVRRSGCRGAGFGGALYPSRRHGAPTLAGAMPSHLNSQNADARLIGYWLGARCSSQPEGDMSPVRVGPRGGGVLRHGCGFGRTPRGPVPPDVRRGWVPTTASSRTNLHCMLAVGRILNLNRRRQGALATRRRFLRNGGVTTMPAALTYPGVYIEEVPSGVRTITGVATSITAFVGRALRGPVNTPTRVQSFAEYSRVFGGLWAASTMGYAANQFFQHGGSDALDRARLQRRPRRQFGHPHPADRYRRSGAGGFQPRPLGERAARHGGPPHARHRRHAAVQSAGRGTRPAGRHHGGGLREFRNVSVDPASPRFVDTVLERAVGAGQRAQPRRQSARVPPTARSMRGGHRRTTMAATSPTPRSPATRTIAPGIFALEAADLFNLLCIPPLDADDATCAAPPGRRRDLLPGPPRDADHRSAGGLDGQPERPPSATAESGAERPARHHRQRRCDATRRSTSRACACPIRSQREPPGGLRPLRRGGRDHRPHRRPARRLEGAGRAWTRPSRACKASPTP